MNKSICFNYKYNSDYIERINLIKEIGFDSVFLYSQYNPVKYIDLIHESALSIDSLHLPYKKMNQGKSVDSRYVNVLWKEDHESYDYVRELIEEVKFAHQHNIGTVVMHITGGDTPPAMNKFGITNIEQVVNTCEKYNITLCLENLRRLDYLDYVFKHIDSKKLMFCFDSGHAHAMTKNLNDFPWEKFGNKLYYLHLNDNNGDKDQHLAPFDGNINWLKLMKQILFFNKDIGLTLEVRSNEEIRNHFSEREYLNHCYNSLNKLQSIIEEK